MAKAKSNNALWAKRLLIVVLILCIGVVIYHNKKYLRRAYRYITHRYYKTNFKPSTFPDDYAVHGIDISHYQDVLNWKNLVAINTDGDTVHFSFVFMKATEGILIEDDTYEENWEDAKDNHIVRGAYHYFLPDRSSKLQAMNFIRTVKLEQGDLPPVVDIEETRGKSKQEIVAGLKDFIADVETNYKAKPIIYSNINFIEDYLADDFKNYPFWIAHYYQDELAVDDSIQCLFWQHSNNADLLGINGNVDANVFNGSTTDFNALRIK